MTWATPLRFIYTRDRARGLWRVLCGRGGGAGGVGRPQRGGEADSALARNLLRIISSKAYTITRSKNAVTFNTQAPPLAPARLYITSSTPINIIKLAARRRDKARCPPRGKSRPSRQLAAAAAAAASLARLYAPSSAAKASSACGCCALSGCSRRASAR
eukprot:scaffold3957_cov50-Phaeocystis_antarctica.AAC.1